MQHFLPFLVLTSKCNATILKLTSLSLKLDSIKRPYYPLCICCTHSYAWHTLNLVSTRYPLKQVVLVRTIKPKRESRLSILVRMCDEGNVRRKDIKSDHLDIHRGHSSTTLANFYQIFTPHPPKKTKKGKPTFHPCTHVWWKKCAPRYDDGKKTSNLIT